MTLIEGLHFSTAEGRPVSDHSLHATQPIGTPSNNGDVSPPSRSWDIERRRDGALLVRMHSVDRRGRPLPDAVFTFRKGDPQYEYWELQAKSLQER